MEEKNITPHSNDRREFFRINDKVIVDYNLLSQEESENIAKTIDHPGHDESDHEQSQIRSLDIALRHVIDQINQTDRDIARALRLLDEKITLIAQAFYRAQSNSEEGNIIDANLSGGGIAFLVDQRFNMRDPVEIKLQLLPSGSYIHALAKVVSCTPYPAHGESYYLRLAFTHMSEVDTNLLVKHTLNRQAELLRIRRTQHEQQA